MTSHRRISRRTVLRGLGAAVALPMMDMMTPCRAVAASRTAGAPLRMAFLFVPNGVNVDHWTPQKVGFDYDLPATLQPLAPVKSEVSVLTGLTHDKGRANGDGPGDHARSASVFLTGAQPRKTSGSDIRSGRSVDQVAAQVKGEATRFPSLELGCEKGRNAGNCDSGYSCAYSSNIAWASPTMPVSKEINPRLVFERLFSDAGQAGNVRRAEQDALRKSILDYVGEDARQLHSRLGRGDQQKLDEYLTGVREIERRIDRHEEPVRRHEGTAPPEGIPQEYAEHIRLMCDMMVLAFQTDLTRISTFMLANAGSNRSYRPIGVPDGHHDLSHHGGNREKLSKIAQINKFHVTQFAYLLDRLKSIPEGEGTMLDHMMIVYGSGLSDGNRHNNENLPILLAGRGGGSLTPGRHVVYRTETPLTNLFVSMLDRFDVPIDFLGDSTGRLDRLA